MGKLLDKENELIKRIANNPMSENGIFDREKDFTILVNATDTFLEYDEARMRLEKQSRQASYMYPGDAESQINMIRSADIARQDAHNTCIAATDRLNRLYEKYGMEPFFEFDRADKMSRYAVESVAMAYCSETKESLQNQGHEYNTYEKRRDQSTEINQATTSVDEQNLEDAHTWHEQYMQQTKEQDPEWVAAKTAKNPNFIEDEIKRMDAKKSDTLSASRQRIERDIAPIRTQTRIENNEPDNEFN